MATDEFDLEEINRLVEGLAKPLKVTPPTAPFAPLADAAASATDQSAPLTPGQRWTTATLLMPAARTEPRKHSSFRSRRS